MNEWWETLIIGVAGVLTIFNLVDKIISWVKGIKQMSADIDTIFD